MRHITDTFADLVTTGYLIETNPPSLTYKESTNIVGCSSESFIEFFITTFMPPPTIREDGSKVEHTTVVMLRKMNLAGVLLALVQTLETCRILTPMMLLEPETEENKSQRDECIKRCESECDEFTEAWTPSKVKRIMFSQSASRPEFTSLMMYEIEGCEMSECYTFFRVGSVVQEVVTRCESSNLV